MTQEPRHLPRQDTLRLLAASRADSGGHAASAAVAQSMAWWQSLSNCSSQQAPTNGLLAAGRPSLWCLLECLAAALHAVLLCTCALQPHQRASSVTDPQQPDPDSAVLQVCTQTEMRHLQAHDSTAPAGDCAVQVVFCLFCSHQTLDLLLKQPCALLLCLSPARVCLAACACSWRSLAWLRTQRQHSSVSTLA